MFLRGSRTFPFTLQFKKIKYCFIIFYRSFIDTKIRKYIGHENFSSAEKKPHQMFFQNKYFPRNLWLFLIVIVTYPSDKCEPYSFRNHPIKLN